MILKNVNFSIFAKEKVGIIGRTGAGKSTIVLSLLGFVELYFGNTFIDGVNRIQLSIENLRREITIIPQDPYLFEESLQHSIDPLNLYSESELIRIIKLLNVEEMFQGKINDEKILNLKISENSGNLSKGEKQLIFIGSALLRKSRIVLIDEATASIDEKTEKILIQSIYKQFHDATMVLIAHRLKTVLNCDRIFVMENGEIVESASPSNLLQNLILCFINCQGKISKSMVIEVY